MENGEESNKESQQEKDAAVAVREGDQTLAPKDPSRKAGGSRKGPKSTDSRLSSKAKLDMPSQQAKRLTTAYHELLRLRDARSVEGTIHAAMKNMEAELWELNEQLDAVVPESDLQRKFKDSWIAKNLTYKVEFLKEVQAALREEQQQKDEDRRSRRSRSSTSSARRAAEAEETRLLQEKEQLERLQQARRRQREEEAKLQEQREQADLQRRIDEARVKRAQLEDDEDADDISLASSGIQFPLRVPRLPRMEQPTAAWLETTQTQQPVDPNLRPNAVWPAPAPLMSTASSSLVQHLLLAQAKLPQFKGDPLEYLWFIQAFQAQVDAVVDDPQRKLYILLQSLQGEPHTLVKACQLASNPSVGFQRAKQLLHERYGHPVRQALAFKAKLLGWPTVKGSSELTDYSIQLQLCLEIKNNAGRLEELDAASLILQLAAKLPHKLQLAWQNRVVDIETQHEREAKFCDFVKFVMKNERARNHPVFGQLTQDARSTPKSAKTLATQVDDSETQHQMGIPAAANIDDSTAARGLDCLATDAGSGSSSPNAFKAPCLFCSGQHAASKCSASLTREDKKAKLRGLCFACLKPGHSARSCKFRLKCSTCGGLHPTVLHEERQKDDGTGGSEVEKKTPTTVTEKKEKALVTDAEAEVDESSLATLDGGAKAAIATVPVRLRGQGNGHEVVVKAILDSASTATFIKDDLARQLGLHSRTSTLNLTTMSGEDNGVKVKTVYGLTVSDYYGNAELDVGVAYAVRTLPPVNQQEGVQVGRWPHLNEVEFLWDKAPAEAELLIGQNVKHALKPLEVKDGPEEGPYAVRTALGWALHGPLDGPAPSPRNVALLTGVEDISAKLDQLHNTDFDEVYDFAHKELSRNEEEWMREARNSIRLLPEGKFCVDLPVRAGMLLKLQNNYDQARQRLRGLLKKFATNPGFKQDYIAFVEKMVKSGYVEEVQEAPTQLDYGDAVRAPRPPGPGKAVINYVPHHGVYHPKKPNKIRVVFNCASKFRGVALNDCLKCGPDLTSSIVGVLLRFRQFAVAFMADIEAMFYRVVVPEHQRDLLRFLWWADASRAAETGATPTDLRTYRLKVHLFGATSSPSVANFALRHAADRAFEDNEVSAAVRKTVHRNFYVDDCLKSAPSTQGAIDLAQGLIRACQYGGFKLGKFVSSSRELLSTLTSDQLAANLAQIDLNDVKADPLGSLQERALGVAWKIAQDCFVFSLGHQSQASAAEAVTRRKVLSRLSQVYDPLGFAAPVVIVARIQFRRLTAATDKGWDDALDDDEAQRWHRWTHKLQCLHEIRVPRWLGSLEDARELQELHVFCDASNDAYAAAVYLRVQRQVAFVLGKARVTPPKTVTIPRLELTAAKLAAEMASTVQKELDIRIARRVMWSDSQTVLKYLNNKEKRFHTFVANRVNCILNLTTPEEWRYVPTAQNPADAGSRGIRAGALKGSTWLQGPEFLRADEEDWPKLKCPELSEGDPEIKRVVVACATSQEQASVQPFINEWAARYSRAHRFRRAVAIMIRVKSALRGRGWTKGVLQWPELQVAEEEAMKWLQRETWPQEWDQLTKGRQIRVNSPLAKLAASFRNGLIVMNSRTRVSLPIVPDGPLAELLAMEAHQIQGHQGRQATLAALNQNYWVQNAGKWAKKVAYMCSSCQRRKAQPRPRPMSDLPESRLREGGYPFETTGVDCFGPLKVAEPGGKQAKAYGVIFTCATTRAVHLELAESLHTTSFINALRRFIARRGNIRRFISDNGTNFDGAKRAMNHELSKLMQKHQNDPELLNELRARKVYWEFNPPTASHYGGFYERLIRSARQILNAIMDQPKTRAFSAAAMETLLCECEAILNSRPLTTTSNDINDLSVLTPNCLLLGREQGPHTGLGEFRSTAKALRNQWKQVQHFASQFWHRWTKEYLTLLRKRTKWFRGQGRQLRLDDVVLVVDPIKPRNYWRLGRIIKIHVSRDGEIRAADVITNKGILTRPVLKLCLLETASNEAVDAPGHATA